MKQFIVVPILLFLSTGFVNGKLYGRNLRQGEPCNEPGFFGDAENCRKFYRCAEHESNVDGMPSTFLKFEFYCPEETAFDEALSVCNYPHNVPNHPPCPPMEQSSSDTGGSDSNIDVPMSPENNNNHQNNNQHQGAPSADRVQQPAIVIVGYPFPILLPRYSYHSNSLYYKK